MKKIRRFIRDQRGANLVEYIILVGVVALFVLLAARFFGSSVSSKFGQKAGEVTGI